MCADGSVLYADSEGAAGIIASSADEALEPVIGLPGWRGCTRMSPDDGEEKILACALDFPGRSPVGLVARLRAALLRTEPHYVLLDADEGCAYDRLAPAGPPLWSSMTDELRLAAVLAGLRGDTGDLPLLREVRDTNYGTACGLGGMLGPGAGADELHRWARELDESMFGTDPSDEPVSTWTDLARDQGMTELARVTLIRELDAVLMDRSGLRRPGAPRALAMAPLSALAHDFEKLGDLPQALRAQRLYASLQETAWDRASARHAVARLERRAGRLSRAADSLAAVRNVLATPDDDSLRHWRQVNLGRFTAEEHYRLVLALAEAGRPEEARTLLTAADALLGELSENAANGIRELAERIAAKVREDPVAAGGAGPCGGCVAGPALV